MTLPSFALPIRIPRFQVLAPARPEVPGAVTLLEPHPVLGRDDVRGHRNHWTTTPAERQTVENTLIAVRAATA